MNTLKTGKVYEAKLQEVLYRELREKEICTTRYNNAFFGADTVYRFIQAKPTVSALASSYSSVPTQELTQTEETFSLDMRYGGSIALSDEDMKEVLTVPSSREQSIRGWQEVIGKLHSADIVGEYANASSSLYIRDGDLATASNSGGTNSIKASASNIYEITTLINLKMDLADVPTEGRWWLTSPYTWQLLSNTNILLRSTPMGDSTVRTGYSGFEINGLKILRSNSLYSASNTRYELFGQGKPIDFASTVMPNVTFVDSSTQKDNWVNYMKVRSKWGVKSFTDGINKLGVIHMYTA